MTRICAKSKQHLNRSAGWPRDRPQVPIAGSVQAGARATPAGGYEDRRRLRSTKDIDLRLPGSSDGVLTRLQEAARLDLGDFFTHGVRIFPCVEPVDMRLGFDRLAQLARERVGRDPVDGAAVFLFGGPSSVAAEDLVVAERARR